MHTPKAPKQKPKAYRRPTQRPLVIESEYEEDTKGRMIQDDGSIELRDAVGDMLSVEATTENGVPFLLDVDQAEEVYVWIGEWLRRRCRPI